MEAALFSGRELSGNSCDEVWYVYTEEGNPIRRRWKAVAIPERNLLALSGNQVSDQVFREHTDYVIENNGDLKDDPETDQRRDREK